MHIARQLREERSEIERHAWHSDLSIFKLAELTHLCDQ
jgi:hypothetical protein